MLVRILIACEESQAVTIEMRRLGHEAYSCDLLECSGGHPEWHIKGDVIPLLNGFCRFQTMDGMWHEIDSRWDMIIAFPPCTDLASSGARHFAQKRADGRQQRSIAFFMMFVNADCDRIAIENPIGIMSSIYRKPDQIVQPWMFGHGETKATCFWLKGMPILVATHIVEGREHRVWRMPPSADRARLRSKTYAGIARAMAEQWAGPCLEG